MGRDELGALKPDPSTDSHTRQTKIIGKVRERRGVRALGCSGCTGCCSGSWWH